MYSIRSMIWKFIRVPYIPHCLGSAAASILLIGFDLFIVKVLKIRCIKLKFKTTNRKWKGYNRKLGHSFSVIEGVEQLTYQVLNLSFIQLELYSIIWDLKLRLVYSKWAKRGITCMTFGMNNLNLPQIGGQDIIWKKLHEVSHINLG